MFVELAVVAFRPQMLVACRVDQLHVDAHRVAGFLHAAFENVRHAELLPISRQIFRAGSCMRGRSARDDFQRADLGQPSQDFVLDAFGEIGVVLVAAQVFERQHRDRFFRDRGWCGRRCSQSQQTAFRT